MKVLVAVLLGTLGLVLLLAGWKGTGTNLLSVLTNGGSGATPSTPDAPPVSGDPAGPSSSGGGQTPRATLYSGPVRGSILGSIVHYPAGQPALSGVWT